MRELPLFSAQGQRSTIELQRKFQIQSHRDDSAEDTQSAWRRSWNESSLSCLPGDSMRPETCGAVCTEKNHVSPQKHSSLLPPPPPLHHTAITRRRGKHDVVHFLPPCYTTWPTLSCCGHSAKTTSNWLKLCAGWGFRKPQATRNRSNFMISSKKFKSNEHVSSFRTSGNLIG